MTKKYQVIYTDHGDTCDYKARCLGFYNSFDEAHKSMLEDIEVYQQAYLKSWEDDEEMRNKRLPVTHEDNDTIVIGDDYYGCQWQILEVEV